MDRFSPALSEVNSSGQVLGSFSLPGFFSWTDGRLDPLDQYMTLVHEDIHAKSISGSHFHTNLLSGVFNRLVGDDPPELPVQYTDFVDFHESHPVAFDLISGQKTSHYDDAAIRALAELTSDLSRRIAKLCPHRTEVIEVIVLRSIYLAFSDLYTEGDADTSAKLLETLEEIVVSAERGQSTPFESMDPTRDLSPQLATVISTEMRDRFGISITHIGDELRAAFAFSWMAGALLVADREGSRKVHRAMLLPTLNYVFDGALIPHGVFDPIDRSLTIASTELQYSRVFTGKAIDHPFRSSYDNHRRQRFASRQSFVFESFFSECAHLEPEFDSSMVFPQLSRQLSLYPATLCLLADEVLDPVVSGRRGDTMEELHEYMSGCVPFWSTIRENYHKLRMHVGRELGAACADMPHWIAMSLVDFVQRYSDAGVVDFSVTDDDLFVFFGDQLFSALRPG